jgi:transcriptional regulator with XRE-family HTH domain
MKTTIKKQKKLTLEELQICYRLSLLPKILNFKAKEFAQALDMSLDHYNNYHYARAPLRVETALWVCRKFNINEKWLATGEGWFSPSLFTDLGKLYKLIKPRMLFSDAYRWILSTEFDQRLNQYFKNRAPCHPSPSDYIIAATTSLRFLSDYWLGTISDKRIKEFSTSILPKLISSLIIQKQKC